MYWCTYTVGPDDIMTEETFRRISKFIMMGNAGMKVNTDVEEKIWARIWDRLYFQSVEDPVEDLAKLYPEVARAIKK